MEDARPGLFMTMKKMLSGQKYLLEPAFDCQTKVENELSSNQIIEDCSFAVESSTSHRQNINLSLLLSLIYTVVGILGGSPSLLVHLWSRERSQIEPPVQTGYNAKRGNRGVNKAGNVRVAP